MLLRLLRLLLLLLLLLLRTLFAFSRTLSTYPQIR
jgi:hypothetical protein